jgi:hypothetical protein
MTLTQARRYAVQKQTSIEFHTASGIACLIDQQGVARVPELKAAPDFVMTTEFDQASAFTLIRGAQRKLISRDELSQLAGPAQAATHGHDEDE